jgi:hypothetical protein
VTVLGRESPFALYSADLASMEIEGGGAAFDYNPYDAQVGFVFFFFGVGGGCCLSVVGGVCFFEGERRIWVARGRRRWVCERGVRAMAGRGALWVD